MELTLNKTELAGALPALGKLVSRMAFIQTFQAVQIEGKEQTLFFKTRNISEEIEFRMTADLGEDIPAVLVSFEQFRLAVRNCRNKSLGLGVENGGVFIDGMKLAPVNGRFPVPDDIPDQGVCVTELPADTLSALEKLAPIASKEDSRSVLRGINLSGDGATAANGKELSNIPLSLEMTGSVTIPFPLALLATKAYGQSGRLSTWQKDNDTLFELSLGSWTWRGKAHQENYPNWKLVVPERTEKTHFVSFLPDRAERLRRYLKSVPDDPQNFNGITLGRLPEVPDNLHLESSNGLLFSVLAEFDPNWGELHFTARKENLLHLLNAGHTRIELNDAFGPFVGTGGMGQYVAMPIRKAKQHPAAEQEMKQDASPATDARTEAQTEQAGPQHQESTVPTNTTSNKEKTTMNESPTINHTMPGPVPTFTMSQEPENKLNPLDELTTNIEAMRSKLKTMFDESAALSRKVREVAISQRQKEREYQQTKRTIERIRTASGF